MKVARRYGIVMMQVRQSRTAVAKGCRELLEELCVITVQSRIVELVVEIELLWFCQGPLNHDG